MKLALIFFEWPLILEKNTTSLQVVNAYYATVNVSKLVSGVYFYEVVAENGTIVRNTFVKK